MLPSLPGPAWALLSCVDNWDWACPPRLLKLVLGLPTLPRVQHNQSKCGAMQKTTTNIPATRTHGHASSSAPPQVLRCTVPGVRQTPLQSNSSSSLGPDQIPPRNTLARLEIHVTIQCTRLASLSELLYPQARHDAARARAKRAHRAHKGTDRDLVVLSGRPACPGCLLNLTLSAGDARRKKTINTTCPRRRAPSGDMPEHSALENAHGPHVPLWGAAPAARS